jgi:predicted XRE-type DNA-binding protein
VDKLQFDNIFEAIVEDRAEAADLEFRADLMLVLRQVIAQRKLDPKAVAELLEISQPRVSELMRGKVHLYSSEKLIKHLSRLGYRLRASYHPNRKSPISVSVIQSEAKV